MAPPKGRCAVCIAKSSARFRLFPASGAAELSKALYLYCLVDARDGVASVGFLLLPFMSAPVD